MPMSDADEDAYGTLWTCLDPSGLEEQIQAISEIDKIIDEFDPLMEISQEVPEPPPRNDSLKHGSVNSRSGFDSCSDDPFRGEDPFKDYASATGYGEDYAKPVPKPRQSQIDKRHSASSLLNTDPLPRPLNPKDFDGESIDNLDFGSEDDIDLPEESDNPCGIVPPPTSVSVSPNVKILKPTNKLPRLDKALRDELYVTDFTKRKFCKRWCVLDVVDEVLLVYSDNKSNVSKRIIPLRVIDNVKPVCMADDRIYKNELVISPPSVSGVAPVCRSIFIGHKDQVQLSEWANSIMKLIIERDNRGGEDENPQDDGGTLGHKLVTSLVSRKIEKSGFIKMRGVHGKRLFATIGHLLVYFDSHEDFSACLPVHHIDMKLANVKRSARYPNSLELNTPSMRTYYFVFDHPEEMESWIRALENATKLGLTGGSCEALIEARKNPSNNFCADCGSTDTVWASINFGVVICSICSGLHRELGAKPTSKVRGLEYDSSWTPSTLKLLAKIGNENGNKFWEAKLPPDSELKPKPDWPIDRRRDFIVKKYREKKFADLHLLDPEELKEMLRTTVQTDSILDTMKMHFSLDHDFCIDDTDLIQLSKAAGQVVQSEFLIQNSRWLNSSTPSSLKRRPRPRSIIKKGYVSFKVCLADANFSRRWCALAGGTAHFHVDEKDSVAKESLDLANDVVAISVTEKNESSESTLTLFTNQRAFSIHSYENDENDLYSWLHAFCRSISPDVCKDYLSEDDASQLLLVGLVSLKRGSKSEWHNHWACLTTTRRLLLLDESLESHHVDDNDLRMVTTPISEQEESGGDLAFSFQVTTFTPVNTSTTRGGRSSVMLYMRSRNNYLTKMWRSKVENGSTKCGDNLEDQVLTSANVPLIVSECVNFVSVNAEGVDGIYRVGGIKSREEQLFELFKKCPQSVHLTRGDWEVPEVTGALKKFLRGLEDPPMKREFYEKWLDASKMPDHNLKLQWYQYHLKSLPTVNYSTLRAIFIHIDQLLKTNTGSQRMDAHGMARIFAPVLLSVYKDNIAGAPREIGIIHDFITYYVWLFEIDEEEQRKQEEEQRAIDKIQRLQSLGKSIDLDLKDKSWKIPITLDVCCPGEPPVSQVDVSCSTTAQDVLNTLKNQGKLNVLKHLALFEIIVENERNVEVERNIFPTESVYAVCMNWRGFSEEYRSKVKLVVKQNYIFDRFEHAYEPDVSRNTTVQYSDNRRDRVFPLNFRNFAERSIQLQDSTLRILKNKNVVDECDIHKIDVYHGIEHRRKPPNEFGITINPRNEGDCNGENETSTTSFRQAVCFSSRQELYRWLAAIHYAKFPDWKLFAPSREGRVDRPTAPIRFTKPGVFKNNNS